MKRKQIIVSCIMAVAVVAMLLGVMLSETECHSEQSADYSRHNVISPYDDVFREVSLRYGYDWRFVAAIAYAESKFKDSIVSGAGAVGLMQITPVVARHFGVSPDSLFNPRTNIDLGVRLLQSYGDSFRFPQGTRDRDRISIMLASYNCGIGHIYDVRRMAVRDGADYNSWTVLQKYLDMKSEPEIYGDSVVVRCGRFDDVKQTTTFVRRVLNRYDYYKNLSAI